MGLKSQQQKDLLSGQTAGHCPQLVSLRTKHRFELTTADLPASLTAGCRRDTFLSSLELVLFLQPSGVTVCVLKIHQYSRWCLDCSFWVYDRWETNRRVKILRVHTQLTASSHLAGDLHNTTRRWKKKKVKRKKEKKKGSYICTSISLPLLCASCFE